MGVGDLALLELLLYDFLFGRGAIAMKAFIVACLAAIVVAAIGVIALNSVQEPADQAFKSPYARLGA